MLLTILVLAAALYFLAGRILRPLSHLTQFMCSIDDKNMCHRVDLPRSKDAKCNRLTQSFNNMMDRLEGSYTAQKNFAANAAHELKTPFHYENLAAGLRTAGQPQPRGLYRVHRRRQAEYGPADSNGGRPDNLNQPFP